MSVNDSYLLGLFSNSSSQTSANMLAALYPAASTTTSASTTPSAPPAPTPPWDLPGASNITGSTGSTPAALTPSQNNAVQQALAGLPILNPSAAQLTTSSNNPAVNSDYKNLFALYQALNTLYSLSQQAQAPGNSSLQNTQLQRAFNNGLQEVSSYLQGKPFQTVTVVQGSVSSQDTGKVGVAQANDTYTSQTIVEGSSGDPVASFQGPLQFSATVTNSSGTSQTVNFDLSQLGSNTSLANVVNYMNSQFAAAGVKTTISTQRTAGQDETIQVGSNTVTLGTTPDQYALVVNGVPTETVSFSAPQTADAVYVSQGSGAGGAAGQQLLKFQSDATQGGTPPATIAQPQDTNVTAGEAWEENLPSNVTGVQATATGPDGSVYVLGNVDGTISGQGIQGSSDVALMKYDSAGNLQFTQTLGAGTGASGLGLAVSQDGEVAVTGQVTGSLTPGDGLTAGSESAFVSVYNGTTGDQLWSQSIASDSGAKGTAVAFGANDTVYLTGQTNSQILGATGSPDPAASTAGFLAGFDSSGKQTFVTEFGGAGANNPAGLVVDGNQVLVGGTENGSAVVRSWQISASGSPSVSATRNLGALGGGSVAGIALDNGQLVVAGTTHNTALAAGTTTAQGGAGSNAFVAALDPSLTPSGADSIAYYQNKGSTTVTAVTIGDGKVYIAGQTGPTLTDNALTSPGSSTTGSTSTSSSTTSTSTTTSNLSTSGASTTSSTASSSGTSSQTTTGQAGYIAEIDPTTGQVGFTTALSGEGGIAAPTSISVGTGGASVLDRLGLPTGTISQATPSDLLTTATSLQAGDYFYVQPGPGQPLNKVTVQADDTLSTLASRIAQASDFRLSAKVTTSMTAQTLTLTTSVPLTQVQILAGPSGQNALPGLGLTPGLIQPAPASSSSSSSTKPQTTFGLNLPALDLNSTADAKHAASQILFAISEVQSAYQGLVSANTPQTPQSKASSGKVPQSIQNELANYQAGLARLTGA